MERKLNLIRSGTLTGPVTILRWVTYSPVGVGGKPAHARILLLLLPN